MSTTAITRVFCPPPLGKPNPEEPKPKGRDTRSRVYQKGGEGISCVYDVLKLLRERWRAPNIETSHPRRKFEILASKTRKELNATCFSLPSICAHLEKFPLFKTFTREQIGNQLLIAEIRAIEEKQPTQISVFTVFNDFSNQREHPTLYEYLNNLQRSTLKPIYDRFFTSLNISLKDCFEEMKDVDLGGIVRAYGTAEWSKVPPLMKCKFAHCSMELRMIRAYRLKISTWHPKDSIAYLMRELANRGPLIAGGQFGLSFYQGLPQLAGYIEGRRVVAWSPDQRIESKGSGHTILIVGAEKGADGKEFVYYVDPKDPSDPKHPETQFIYKISYSRLLKSIVDLWSMKRQDAPNTVGYLVYGPAHAPSQDSSPAASPTTSLSPTSDGSAASAAAGAGAN